MTPPLNIDYDVTRDVLTIDGIAYSGEIFRQWAHTFPPGQAFRMVSREGGVITILTLDEPASAAPPDVADSWAQTR